MGKEEGRKAGTEKGRDREREGRIKGGTKKGRDKAP